MDRRIDVSRADATAPAGNAVDEALPQLAAAAEAAGVAPLRRIDLRSEAPKWLDPFAVTGY